MKSALVVSTPSSEQDVAFGLAAPGSAAAALVALKSGGAPALVGALIVVGLVALAARKLTRLAGGPADETDRPRD